MVELYIWRHQTERSSRSCLRPLFTRHWAAASHTRAASQRPHTQWLLVLGFYVGVVQC